MILAAVHAASSTLPDGYPWVAMGWSGLGFGSGYLVGRVHCWRKKTKGKSCDA